MGDAGENNLTRIPLCDLPTGGISQRRDGLALPTIRSLD
jgi:hypothetical protein